MSEFDVQPGRALPNEPALTRAQREADNEDLRAGLSGLAGMVAGGRGVNELLAEVAEFAAQAIPGVVGAGVSLLCPPNEGPHIQAWAVTAEFVREIDKLQYEVLDEGPSITCMQTQRPLISGSLGSDQRWRRFGARVARLRVHSALSLPLLIGDQVVGAISSYAFDRDAFAGHALRLGEQFAGPAAVSVYNAQLLARAREGVERLQGALGSRAVIDQAIGILRSRAGGSSEEAFARLLRISQSQNVKIAVIAQQLVDEAVRRARARHSQI